MKKIYSILVLVALTCLLAMTSGYDYRITGLYKAEGVTIGGKSPKVGDQFYKTDKINWNNNNEARIRIVEIANGTSYVLYKTQVKSNKPMTIEVFLRTAKSSGLGRK